MSTTLSTSPASSPTISTTGAHATEPRFDNAAVVDLAEVVDRDGLDAHLDTLAALARRASLSGVSPVLVDVMLGTSEPYVARLRAFVRVGAAVADPRRARVSPGAGSLLAA